MFGHVLLIFKFIDHHNLFAGLRTLDGTRPGETFGRVGRRFVARRSISSVAGEASRA